MTTPWPTEAQAKRLAQHIGAAYQAILEVDDEQDQASDAGDAILQILRGLPMAVSLLALAGGVASCLDAADEHSRASLMGAFVRIVGEMLAPEDDPDA